MKTIIINPVQEPRQTRADVWKKRPIVLKYRAYCDELRLKLPGYKIPAEKEFVEFIIPMPPSWSQKKRNKMNGEPHQQKPDIDNYQKAFMDALCEDDGYIWDIHTRKIWGEVGAIRIWSI